MQEDTYRGDGLNLYTYCANNPVRYIDPSGHWCDKKEDIYRGLVEKNGLDINNIDPDTKQRLMAEASNIAKGLDVGRNDTVIELPGIVSPEQNRPSLAKPGEDLYVGTYAKSSYWNKKTGLNATHTPHHAIQDAVSTVSHGKGITINLRKDIHVQTETYGRKRQGLTNRQNLAADIAELRVLLKNAGYERSVINAQLNELIRQNKALGGFEK